MGPYFGGNMNKWVAGGIILLIASVGALGYWFSLPDSPDSAASTTPTSSPTPTPTPTGITAKLLFSGDVFWSRQTHRWAQASDLKEAHPFAHLEAFNPDKTRTWVANLECPITETELTDHQLEVELKFNCQPEYVQHAAKHFDIFSLATNHTDNQNEIDGFNQTKKYLTEAGIEYFGHYDNAADQICQPVMIPATATLSDNSITDLEIPVAFCGYHYVFRTPRPGEIEAITQYSQAMPTFAIPHMGEEYVTEPDTLKQNIYRQMIDAGADVVIGSHPHWVQISEAYQGKLIAYSLGNFIFDQRWNDELMKGAVLSMDMKIEPGSSAQWLDTIKNCSDISTCFDQLTQAYQDDAVTLTYDLQSADATTPQTKRGDAALDQWVKQRMRWSETLSQLQ